MYTLAEIAKLIGAEVVGDARAVVRHAQSFATATDGDITFAGDAAYRERLHESPATAVIIAPPAIETEGRNLLVAANPKLAFARAVQILHGKPYTPTGVSADFVKGEDCALGDDLSIHPRVTLGNDVVIGNRVTLRAGVVIGDRCRVGDDTVIYANVSIYDDCEIGSRVVLHSGAVIGADGFGFVPDERGRQVKFLHLGRVIIEDDCEVGANCTVDRGGFSDTVLRRGAKLDNLIQVGHNTEIGENTVVAALTGFSGGTKIGRDCVVAAQVGTREHISVGDGAVLMARAAVTKSVRGGALVGNMIPARDYKDWRRSQAIYNRLPEIYERLKRLEKTVSNLTPESD